MSEHEHGRLAPVGDTTASYGHGRMHYRLAMAAAGIAGPHALECTCLECANPRYRMVVASYHAMRAMERKRDQTRAQARRRRWRLR